MYARVAFPTAVPDALTYAVPPALDELVVPGVRVRARLRAVMRVGFVIERAEEPGCPPEKVISIADLLDATPVVPGSVVELIRFAADYYAAPVGTVVRAAIPSQLLRLPSEMIQLGPRAREVMTGASEPERRLLDRLFEARRITRVRLHADGWNRQELTALLAGLAAKHAVIVTERRPKEHAGGVVSAVALGDLAPEELAKRIGRAKAQGRVVAWLQELGRPALEGEIAASCDCSPGVVAELVKKGVVRKFQQPKLVPSRRWELTAPEAPARLTEHQEAALVELLPAIGAGSFRSALLLGVTGSGKTEVYLRLARAALDQGLQVLILVPEIGLTPALAGHLAVRFGGRVAVLHSSMAEGERFAAWERAQRGRVEIVAGPRSAIWAPLQKLGLIVVDEEQDGSYKQEEEPRYNARDLALMLGRTRKIPVLLASATPSMEALRLVAERRLEVFELPERVAGGKLPAVEIVDLKEEEPEPGEHGQRWLSRRVRSMLGDRVGRGEQAILLVNRRGWAPVLLCRECGHQATCRDCSIPLTIHRRQAALVCHYCGFRREIPERCPRCTGAVLEDVGAGTEKIASKVRELLPTARVDILDRDTARSPAQLLTTLERFSARESDVLVGTQMVSKGHHFPAVTLTVVVNADALLGFPDFRGAERTFHMLTQVAGRSGRGEQPGEVVIQTYHPEHYAVVAAVTHDLKAFADQELRYRQAFRYPPYHRLVLVRFESENEAAALAAAQAASRAMEPLPDGLRLIGPSPAPLARLRGRWRVQILVLAPGRPALREAIARVMALAVPRAVHRVIDVDPHNTV